MTFQIAVQKESKKSKFSSAVLVIGSKACYASFSNKHSVRFLVHEHLRHIDEILKFQNVDLIVLDLDHIGSVGLVESFLRLKKNKQELKGVQCLLVSSKNIFHLFDESLIDDFYLGSIESPLFMKKVEALLRFHSLSSVMQYHEGVSHIDLAYMAYYDPVTGLPNRQLFEMRLNSMLNLPNKNLSILYLDLDGFKHINDCYGHDAGDWLLNQVAYRIKSHLRRSDIVTRLGGDEFGILLLEVNDIPSITSITQRLLTQVSQPYIWNRDLLNVTASIGCARYPYNGNCLNVLMQTADQSMYQAKQLGKNCFAIANR